MSGKRQNIHGFERKRAKQADRRRAHEDKYANRQNDAALSGPGENEERDDDRR